MKSVRVVEWRERYRGRAMEKMGEKGGRGKTVIGIERAREQRRRGGVGGKRRREGAKGSVCEVKESAESG